MNLGTVLRKICILVICTLIGITVVESQEDPTASPLPSNFDLNNSFGGKQSASKPAEASRLGSDLYRLWEERTNLYRVYAQADATGLTMQNDLVTVMVVATSDNAASVARASIVSVNGEIIEQYKRWIDARVPVDALVTLSSANGVQYIQRPVEVFPLDGHTDELRDTTAFNTGNVVTEGVQASNAHTWHSQNQTGNGVNVGVIDSFANLNATVTSGNLPPWNRITMLTSASERSTHGTSVAEIIYDMAPSVNFTFSEQSGAVNMANIIVNMAQRGNKVISSSVGHYNSEAGDGVGPVSDAIRRVRQDYDTVYVQAAGNQANYNYNRYFRDTDNDGFHEWSSNGDELNDIYSYSDYPIMLYLRWSDWGGSGSSRDYDLFLYTSDGAGGFTSVASSVTYQNGNQPPTESIFYYPQPNTWYYIVISKYSADDTPVVMDLMGHNAPGFEHNDTARSLIDPASSPQSLGVAALDVDSPYNREYYSSVGPTMGAGGTLDIQSAHLQPRIAGYANVSTYNGSFNGTSSAAPHVAGAAALVRSAYSNYSANQTISFLEGRARYASSCVNSYYCGAGRLHLGNPPVSITDEDRDTNGDNIISPSDAVYVINRIGSYNTANASADVDNNQIIDYRDVDHVISRIGQNIR